MCKLLMSINPEHVENILAGKKHFEFRKTRCKQEIESIIIYSTAPVGQVVAEAEVVDVLEDSPEKIWARTADDAGIDKAFFDFYYAGRDIAVAYALGTVRRYKKAKSLADYGVKTAPQSYVYIKSAE